MNPIMGQILLFGGNFAPRGWAFCEGQLLPVARFTTLFSILGTTYGGDGKETFALPDFRGRLTVHKGNGPGLTSKRIGERGGVETNKLDVDRLPTHNHSINASEEANIADPKGAYIAGTGLNVFSTTTDVKMNVDSTSPTGGGLPINNVQPFTGISHIIALEGTYPRKN